MSSVGVTYNSNLCTYRALLHVLAYAAQRQHTPYDIVHDALIGGVVTAFSDRDGRVQDTVLLPSSKCMSTVAPLIEEGFFTSYSACIKPRVWLSSTARSISNSTLSHDAGRYSVWSEGDMCDSYSLIVLLFPDCFVDGPMCGAQGVTRADSNDGPTPVSGGAAEAMVDTSPSLSLRGMPPLGWEYREGDIHGSMAWPGATPEAQDPGSHSTHTAGETRGLPESDRGSASSVLMSEEMHNSIAGAGDAAAVAIRRDHVQARSGVPVAGAPETCPTTDPQPPDMTIMPLLRSAVQMTETLATSPAILPSVQTTCPTADVLELHESRLRVAVMYFEHVNKALQNAQLCQLLGKKDVEGVPSANVVSSSMSAAPTSKSGNDERGNMYSGKGQAAPTSPSAMRDRHRRDASESCASSEEAVLRVMTAHWQRVKLMLLGCILAAEMAYRPAQRWMAVQVENIGTSLPTPLMVREMWSTPATGVAVSKLWNNGSSKHNNNSSSINDLYTMRELALSLETKGNDQGGNDASSKCVAECGFRAEVVEQPRHIFAKLLGERFNAPVEQWSWARDGSAVQDALYDSTIASMVQRYSSIDSKERARHGGSLESLLMHISTAAKHDGHRLSCLPALLYEHARDGKQPVTFDGTFRACVQSRVALPTVPVQCGELQVGLANSAQGLLFDSTPSPLLLMLVQSSQGKLTDQQLRHELREGLLATPWLTLPPARQRVVVDFLRSPERVSRILEKNVSFLAQLVMWMIHTRAKEDENEHDGGGTRMVQLTKPVPVLALCDAATVADAVTRFVLYDTHFAPQVGIFMREVLTHRAITFDCFCDWLNYNCDRVCKPEAPPVSRVLIMLVQFALVQCHWDLDATLKARFNTLKMLVRRQ